MSKLMILGGANVYSKLVEATKKELSLCLQR